LLWGFTKLEFPLAVEQLQAWVEAFAAVAAAADEVSLSQVVWALGHLQYWPGDDVMTALAAEVSSRVLDPPQQQQGQQLAAPDAGQGPSGAGSSSSSSSSSSTDGGGVVLTTATPSTDDAVQLPAQPAVQRSLGLRALCNFLWGCALLGFTPPCEVLHRVWAGSTGDLATAAPQTLSNMLWAAASLGVLPSTEWMHAWAEASSSSSTGHWTSADFSTATWAIGKLAGSSDGRYVTVISSQITSLSWQQRPLLPLLLLLCVHRQLNTQQNVVRAAAALT
jgi:hypothetical protein